MNAYVAEFIGTAFLILLGDGVVANVLLKKSKGFNAGWITITFGWAIAVFVGVYITAPFSGAHINPAVTIGLAIAGKFSWSKVVPYIIAQMLGAMVGAFLSWVCYKKHYDEQNDPELILMSFCTAPAIRSSIHNVLTETIGTFVLIFGVLYLAAPEVGLGALDALPVALLVLGIGLSLGGPTGYAINPARDLGPRIIHALLPIRGKGNSDWRYSWIPVIAPIIGAALAAWIYLLVRQS
jgi:glycerol uptake facilitator protein